jgi:hypothetical protein
MRTPDIEGVAIHDGPSHASASVRALVSWISTGRAGPPHRVLAAWQRQAHECGVVPYSRAWTSSVQTLIKLTRWPGLMNRPRSG